MFCGTRSFSQIDTDPLSTSPKGSKLKQSLSMTKKKKQSSSSNPYSTSGRDKFEKILEELDKKKEKIMLRARSQGDSTVRFTYRSDSDDWIPIVIKKREPKEAKDAKAKSSPRVTKRLSAPPSMKVEKGLEVIKEPKEVVNKPKDIIKVKKRGVYSWGVCFWSLVIVLVLVLLVFGRSFAICWTTIWWYLVPLMKGKSKDFRRKELWRRVSDKRLGGAVDGLRSFKGLISERT